MDTQAISLPARSDRPPPPRRFQRHSKTPLVIGEESISRTRHYYLRRCKKASPTNIYCLPDDLLSDILARLPADYLYGRARLVCRRWYHIIISDAFVNNQFHHSKCGLLLACPTQHPCHPTFITATQAGRVETYELSYRYLNELVNCCNGFVIEMGVDELNCPAYFLFIVNPATKQSLVLPPVQIPGAGAPSTYFSCMAFAASSMKYKIAMAYSRNSLMELAILTIGVDNSWRHVNTDHLPKHKSQVLHGYALMSDGFIHWPSICFNLVITMDVETEILTWGPYPHKSKGFLDLCHLSTGRSLSMVVNCKGVFSWEIWEMISGSGEWRRVLPDIKLGGLLHAFAATGKDEVFTALLHKFTSKRAYVVLLPLGWVNYPEVLAFRFYCKSSRTCVLYNRVRHEISTIELPHPCADYICRVHKDSLRRLWSDVVMDDIFCIFSGALYNTCDMRRRYGLSRQATDAIIVVEAYKVLRDRAPYPPDQVVKELEGKFVFILFDSKASTLFLARDRDGSVQLYWGTAGDGSLVCTDDPNVIYAACGKHYSPFPPGCIFIDRNGLMSFDHPLNKVRGVVREDDDGNVNGVIFQVDLYTRIPSIPRSGSAANWANAAAVVEGD